MHNLRDIQDFINHARLAYQLVAVLPDHDGCALALHYARFITGFYEDHSQDNLDQQGARNITWWHEHTGDTIVYWGGIAHTASGNQLKAGHSAGSYLRDYLGLAYTSIGLTFHHGLGTDHVPTPSPEFAESILGQANPDFFFLDLHAEQSGPVLAWLHSPIKTRVIGPSYNPEKDSTFFMKGSLADLFDIIIHTQEITPAIPLMSPNHFQHDSD
ncbi:MULTISPECIES: erythromycin esterase family protein [unclassified Paenibacillus]|uniref:erythromycin esterase family protein n=1 Tax=unclassified Paenibacillus TaxID=185978 RepID=UPI003627BC75